MRGELGLEVLAGLAICTTPEKDLALFLTNKVSIRGDDVAESPIVVTYYIPVNSTKAVCE